MGTIRDFQTYRIAARRNSAREDREDMTDKLELTKVAFVAMPFRTKPTGLEPGKRAGAG